jgi:hypothetical protein
MMIFDDVLAVIDDEILCIMPRKSSLAEAPTRVVRGHVGGLMNNGLLNCCMLRRNIFLG